MPTINELLVNTLTDGEKEFWSRAVALLIEHKASFGAAEIPDEQITDLAPNFFQAMIAVVVNSRRELMDSPGDPRARGRLRQCEWFYSFCRDEAVGRWAGQRLN